MNGTPAVIVKKGGFLASLAGGFFGLLITVVICATGLGIYAIRTVDHRLDSVFDLGQGVVANLDGLREALPPAVSDAFSDRRAFDYLGNVEVDVSLDDATGPYGRGRVVFSVHNQGAEPITLLAYNVVIKDERDVPVHDFRVYAATPLALDEPAWRGPLFSGQREFSYAIPRQYVDAGHSVSVDVAEIRIHDAEPKSALAKGG